MNELYTFFSCPWSQVAKIALYEAGIEFKSTVSKFNNAPSKVLDVCTRGDNPVLFEHDGTAHVGIYAIRSFIERITVNKFSYSNHPEIHRLLFLLDHAFMFEVMRLVYYPKITGERISTIDIQRGYKNLQTHLNHLNWLASKDYFLAGKKISWVDITATAFILCLDYLNMIEWPNVLHLKILYVKMKSRKSVSAVIESFKIIGYKPPLHYNQLDY